MNQAGTSHSLWREFPWLASGFVLMFFSGFGQTYYIALFAGQIKSGFLLSDGQFGGLYTIGTLASALLLAISGRLADTLSIRLLAVLVVSGLAITCLALSLAQNSWILLFCLFGLRFFGQGMSTHTAMTAMGRWFDRKRGRAVSIAGLGLPASEGLMPLAAVFLLGIIGWRQTWMVSGIALLLIGVPLLAILLRNERKPGRGPGEGAISGDPVPTIQWTRAQVLKHPLFYALLPGVLAPPFIITAIFFNQVQLVQIKGWELDWFATTFPILAGVHVVSSLLAGWLVDRFGARKLLPLFLLTLGAAAGLLVIAESWIALMTVMALFGMTMGFAATSGGALWAELYGTVNLGSIRSFTTAVVVLSTAIAPGLVGVLLDVGVSLLFQLGVMTAYSFVAAAWMVFLVPGLNRLVSANAAGMPSDSVRFD